jgi:adenine-specific DNA-methyltransferase
VHRVRALMDEVFGDDNFIALVTVEKTSAQTSEHLSLSTDYVLMYAGARPSLKFRALFAAKIPTDSVMTEYSNFEDQQLLRGGLERTDTVSEWLEFESRFRLFSKDTTTSSRPPGSFPVAFRGKSYTPGNGYWKTGEIGFDRLLKANRLEPRGSSLRYVRFFRDYPVSPTHNIWRDVRFSSRREDKLYVVQSSITLIQRCILMATDPGDLVLDPTCGSGTTAFVAEQWGRRWITIDTSRVALALARARIMGARYLYYMLADSPEGQRKEGEVTRTPPKETPTRGDIRQGFVYERVPHITLKSIANNAEIDVIWEKWQETLEPLRARLNAELGRGASFETPAARAPQDEEFLNAFNGPPHAEERPQGASRSTHGAAAAWEEWEIPREAGAEWPDEAKTLHGDWWAARVARQKEIDASIGPRPSSNISTTNPTPTIRALASRAVYGREPVAAPRCSR